MTSFSLISETLSLVVMILLCLLGVALAAGLVSWWFLVATKLPDSFPPGPRLPLPIVGDSYRLVGGSFLSALWPT